MKKKSLHNNLDNILSGELDKYKIFEEGTDVNLLLEYEKISKHLFKNNIFVRNVDDEIRTLFSSETLSDSKKELLVKLSYSDDVKAYRAIEKFSQNNDERLNDWAKIALQRNRAVIESSLGNTDKVYIATGLGGSGKLLRYHFVVFSKEEKLFSELQKDIIVKEILYALEVFKGINEEISIKENYVTCMCLIPLNIAPEKIFKSIIVNTNVLGNFIEDKIIATNAKKYTEKEINKLKTESEEDFDPDDIENYL